MHTAGTENKKLFICSLFFKQSLKSCIIFETEMLQKSLSWVEVNQNCGYVKMALVPSLPGQGCVQYECGTLAYPYRPASSYNQPQGSYTGYDGEPRQNGDANC